MTEPHPETRARMVDVTSKRVTVREAEARGSIRMSPATRALVTDGRLDKGDALEVARIAGIMAAKKTSDLIPLCHPLALGSVEVSFDVIDEGIEAQAQVRTAERTGVEMEALTAVSVACLTIYDMVKGVEQNVTISDVRLTRKTGGRSGDWSAPGEP